MKPPPEKEALKQVAHLLGHAVEGRPAKSSLLKPGAGADVKIQVGDRTFLVEWKSSGDVASVGSAVRQLRQLKEALGEQTLVVLAVPFMGEAGRQVCEEADVAWLDLAGNAYLNATGLRINLLGHPNPFTRRGRPSSPFAPKSSRIARSLLMHPSRFVSQRNLAEEVEVGEGYTSRVVRRLEEMQLIERNESGEVRASDPDMLLDAWSEDYDFDTHYFVRGHVPVRSGEELLKQIPQALFKAGSQVAATGLAGAWLLTGFAAFRTATFYVATIPPAKTLKAIGFDAEPRGSNLWLVAPKDAGVFHGAKEIQGVPCVHPVQAWLDLKAHPERSREAADHLRKKLLRWKKRRA